MEFIERVRSIYRCTVRVDFHGFMAFTRYRRNWSGTKKLIQTLSIKPIIANIRSVLAD